MIQSATTYPAIVGRVLAHHREQRALAQGALAEAAGVTQSTWSKIERGESALTIEQLQKVAEVLDQSPGKLLEQADRAAARLRKGGFAVHPTRMTPGEAVALGLGLVAIGVVAVMVADALKDSR